MELKIQKRDGSMQEFDIEKIRGGLASAGVEEEMIDHIAPDVAAWVETKSAIGVVKSLDIRAEVLRQLKELAPAAADVYAGYKK